MISYIWATENTLKRNNEDGTHSFVSNQDADYLAWVADGNEATDPDEVLSLEETPPSPSHI